MVRKKAVQSLPTPLVEVVALVDRSFVVGGLGRGGLGLQVGDPNSLMFIIFITILYRGVLQSLLQYCIFISTVGALVVITV